MGNQSDGELLFEQHTSSVPKFIVDAFKKNKPVLYKGKPTKIYGYGQRGFPGQKDYGIHIAIRLLGEVPFNYEDFKEAE